MPELEEELEEAAEFEVLLDELLEVPELVELLEPEELLELFDVDELAAADFDNVFAAELAEGVALGVAAASVGAGVAASVGVGVADGVAEDSDAAGAAAGVAAGGVRALAATCQLIARAATDPAPAMNAEACRMR